MRKGTIPAHGNVCFGQTLAKKKKKKRSFKMVKAEEEGRGQWCLTIRSGRPLTALTGRVWQCKAVCAIGGEVTLLPSRWLARAWWDAALCLLCRCPQSSKRLARTSLTPWLSLAFTHWESVGLFITVATTSASAAAINTRAHCFFFYLFFLNLVFDMYLAQDGTTWCLIKYQ